MLVYPCYYFSCIFSFIFYATIRCFTAFYFSSIILYYSENMFRSIVLLFSTPSLDNIQLIVNGLALLRSIDCSECFSYVLEPQMKKDQKYYIMCTCKAYYSVQCVILEVLYGVKHLTYVDCLVHTIVMRKINLVLNAVYINFSHTL